MKNPSATSRLGSSSFRIEAQAVVRKQVIAELQAQFDMKIEEANRLRSRQERKHLDESEEWEAERRRTKKHIASLEEQLKEAKEAAFKANRASGRTGEK